MKKGINISIHIFFFKYISYFIFRRKNFNLFTKYACCRVFCNLYLNRCAIFLYVYIYIYKYIYFLYMQIISFLNMYRWNIGERHLNTVSSAPSSHKYLINITHIANYISLVTWNRNEILSCVILYILLNFIYY